MPSASCRGATFERTEKHVTKTAFKHDLLTRREAIRRVSALLGGTTLIGQSAWLAGCAVPQRSSANLFADGDVALLDEIADTILPETKTPGAKAAHTGAFMALMVTDTYKPSEKKVFRDGLLALDAECQKSNNVSFMAATPAQRLALLERLDREQKAVADARKAAETAARNTKETKPIKTSKTADSTDAERFLPDQRKTAATGTETGAAAAVTADTPTHYFRMMKELSMLGYFTSEIGCKQALRYVESPGRYDPCVPYTPGQKAWAGHA